MHVQSCCFALLANCFFDVLQGLLSLSYHLLCVQLTRSKTTKHIAQGVWILHDENRRVPLNTPNNAETKLLSNGGVPSTRRRHITHCAWSHNAPAVDYETWIMNHASCFPRATLIETGVYHKFSFLLRASLTQQVRHLWIASLFACCFRVSKIIVRAKYLFLSF